MRTGSIAAFITSRRKTSTMAGAMVAAELAQGGADPGELEVPACVATMREAEEHETRADRVEQEILEAFAAGRGVSSWVIAAHSAHELINSQKAKKLKMSLACVMPISPAIITVNAAKKRPCGGCARDRPSSAAC